MSTVVMKAGVALLLGGAAVVIGYLVYYGFRGLFEDPSIPLAIKIAIPAIIIGVILLLVAAGWDRYRKSKGEHFEEVER